MADLTSLLVAQVVNHFTQTIFNAQSGAVALPTEDEVRTVFDAYGSLPTMPTLSEQEAEFAFRSVLGDIRITQDAGTSITKDHEPWLAERRGDDVWKRWVSYKQFLGASGFAPRVVERMDESTDTIVDFLGDPQREGAWRRRGLVIGDVQSGKTATYLGILNKAADAGYKLIIVLAGGTESLRRQTQLRVDEGVIGRDSRLNLASRSGAIVKDKTFGVGFTDPALTRAQGMTSFYSDFRKASVEVGNFSIDEMSSTPHIFVLKKNKTVLERVHEWLTQQPSVDGKLTHPLLLLDDESDYASVNTRAEEDPTAINAAIRDLLAVSHRSSYLAFTATPFANIFIDHDVNDDLFPNDYIYALEAPSNYVGATRVFGSSDEANDVNVIDLEDAAESLPHGHKSHLTVDELPDSLHTALRTFIVGGAIRELRGDLGERSMLVNVSRFKNVQAQVHELLTDEFSALKSAIELHAANFDSETEHQDIQSLAETFSDLYSNAGVSWKDVQSALPGAVSQIRIGLFNSDRDRRLDDQRADWDQPDRLIAIGGDVLSRGLTLSGLMTSYFHRRVGATDTLLQMARWFGYRDEYEDLTRLWIEPEIAADFRFINDAIDELRADLRMMNRQGRTPADFGLAVRKHPGALLVTARNKMRAGETREKTISVIGRRLETTRLSTSRTAIQGNCLAVTRLVDTISSTLGPLEPGLASNGWTARGNVPKSVIHEFMKAYTPAASDATFSGGAIARWIQQTTSPRFQTWDVILSSGNGQSTPITDQVSIRPNERSLEMGTVGESISEFRVGGKSSRLAGSTDLAALVPPEKVRVVKRKHAEAGETTEAPESKFYSSLNRPALILYLIRPRAGSSESVHASFSECDVPFVPAIKVAVPGSTSDTDDTAGDVLYVINKVAQEAWFPEAEIDDEDELDA